VNSFKEGRKEGRKEESLQSEMLFSSCIFERGRVGRDVVAHDLMRCWSESITDLTRVESSWRKLANTC